jgi:hypothetical protein
MGIFNSNVLDVVIGVIFVYLTLAILCTAANEWVAAVTRRRGRMLEKGIKRLLANQPTQSDAAAEGFASAFYRHPIITKMKDGNRHPAYLSARNFSAVVTDIISTPPASPANATPNADPKTADLGNLEASAGTLPEGEVKRTLIALMQSSARTDPDATQKAIEGWFNDGMDRVSGWYKRRTQLWIILIALALTLIANADTIHIVRQLRADPVLRAAVVEEAKVRAQKPRPSVSVEYKDEDDPTNPTITRNEGNQLSGKETELLGELVGWHGSFRENLRFETLLGWMLTVLALSMGAPFWFDMLNKIMRVRYTGKSPDESAKPPEKPDAAPSS